ncbi:zinc-binding dehydrogenase [Deinococcus pimensis]|uniref:zinc-binding dehydrogenase n=1 Tax=Deinococcus pimensis TaxID=309888 RepID=UPI0004B170C1|nr:zinc-binding dehydrogenase [Deinococcus pimensis]
MTQGALIRLAFDAVGGTATVRLVDTLASGSTLVAYGALSQQAYQLTPGQLGVRDIQVRGYWLPRSLSRLTAQARRDLYTALARQVNAGQLHAPVHATFRLEDHREALALAMRGGLDGKILFAPAAQP